VDVWRRDVAPSNDLRRWYGHDPARFAEFHRRSRAALEREPPHAVLEQLRALCRQGPLTLVFAAKAKDAETIDTPHG
jgi:uncharacterized protein YeaO (DUF488 family)